MYKDFAIDLAKKAGEIMQANFCLGMEKEWKADETPVTITDKKVNQLVIDAVAKNFPGHGVIGEEQSLHKTSEFQWVCDPVDGTLPFSHGVPTFVFMLALVQDGTSILGVIYDPLQKRLCFAQKGGGATMNDKPIHVSKKSSLSERCIISVDTDPARKELIEKGVWTPRLYSIGYECMLVACGEYDGAIFPYHNPWDGAAIKILVEEAGGKVTDLAGRQQRYDQKINGFIASNRLLHKTLVDLLT